MLSLKRSLSLELSKGLPTWLIALILISCGFDAQALTLEKCHVAGVREQVLCGELLVAENPNQPAKQIPLNIVVLPGFSASGVGSHDANKSTPLLILAGGPGQSAVEQSGLINSIFQTVRQTRDIVLIDQRGTGKSNPLQCTNFEIDDLGLNINFAEQDMQAQAKECLVLLSDSVSDSVSGSALAHYSTNQAIDDFEAVRKALGYQQFHLYGGSYGTRAGLVYLRRYPNSIASAVLDSVAPTQVAIGAFGKSSERSFELLLANCAQNPACHAAYPQLKQDLLQLLATLSEVSTHETIADPVTGEPTSLLFARMKFLNTLRTSLYSTSLRKLLPLVIHQANKGNYKPFAGLYGALNSGSGSGMYMGLTLTILCSEDWPRMSREQVAADNDNYVVGNMSSLPWEQMCSVWPHYKVDDRFSQPVVSDVPVLLLSGQLDPVTPPAWAEMAAQTLSRSRHFVAVSGAHTIVTHTCAAKLVGDFLDSQDLAALDDSCLTKKRHIPFMINTGTTSLGATSLKAGQHVTGH